MATPFPRYFARRSGQGVDFMRPELVEMLPAYRQIRDVIAGSLAVKAQTYLYLPSPTPTEKDTPDAKKRYANYLARAVFYNFTEKTLEGLIGQIFTRDPQIDVPPALDPMIADVTGGGVSIVQLAQKMAALALSFGRLGLFVDYPTTDQKVSLADKEGEDLRPSMRCFEPWAVRNWRVIQRGGKQILSLVVFAEDWDEQINEFEYKQTVQYRVLRLRNNVYTQEIWRGGTQFNSGWSVAVPEFAPTMSSGETFDEIPFWFVGSLNNDAEIDSPPMDDLAELNIGHFHNSADYEEAAFLCGQPTPWFSGLTEEWAKNVVGEGAYLGARSAVLLPENASAGLLQAEPNMVAKEAMESKERQAVALGAKLVEQKTVQRTATEAGQDQASETSTLSKVAKNVAAGINRALLVAGQFEGVTVKDDGTAFDLNTEFDLMQLSPEQRKALLAEWQGGAITFEEYRASLRRGGIAYLDDEEAKKQIDEEVAAASAKAVEDAAALADATNVLPADKDPANLPPGE